MSQQGAAPPPTRIVLYGHAACPGVPPVKGMLAQAKAPYDYINIHKEPAAAAHVRALNDGYESVPTLLFPDGSTLTEPSVGELKAKLESLGYHVGPMAWLIGNGWRLLVAAAVLFATARALGWL